MSSAMFVGVLAAVLLMSCTLAEETSHADDKKDVIKHTTTSSTSGSTNDIFLPSNILSLLATGGSVAAGVALVAALGVLILQVFGVRFCQLVGNCEPQYQGYANTQYDAYGPMHAQTAAYASTPTAYQKRSLEYVGPILDALKTAYDKYGVPKEVPVLTAE